MPDNEFPLSNQEARNKWEIDHKVDPYSIPLDELDPAHPALFEHDTFWPYFERLRKEDPVHYTTDSMSGPYWSITRFRDIMAVDTNHKQFSSDINNGGIRMGGRPIEATEQQGMFYLPMFIMQDPPVHDEKRAVLSPSFTPNRLKEMEGLIRKRSACVSVSRQLCSWIRHRVQSLGMSYWRN